MGMGFEYLDGNAADKTVLPNGVTVYGKSYDMLEDAHRRRQARAGEAQGRRRSSRASTTWCSTRRTPG